VRVPRLSPLVSPFNKTAAKRASVGKVLKMRLVV
jgi:hypothetical protein